MFFLSLQVTSTGYVGTSTKEDVCKCSISWIIRLQSYYDILLLLLLLL